MYHESTGQIPGAVSSSQSLGQREPEAVELSQPGKCLGPSSQTCLVALPDLTRPSGLVTYVFHSFKHYSWTWGVTKEHYDEMRMQCAELTRGELDIWF